MTNEAPDRIFADLQCGTWFADEPYNEDDVEYIRMDAACVEVKPGYKTMAWKDGIPWPTEYVSLSEALTIRTVEDVRREALAEARGALDTIVRRNDREWKVGRNGYSNPIEAAYAAITSLINTPAPSRENVQPFEGWVDDKTYVQYEQSEPEQEPVAWQVKDFAGGWITFDSKFKALEYAEPVSAHVRPLYATPPDTSALQAEELRKAKAEAWEQGWQDRLENEGLNCPIVSNPYRRSTDEGGQP